MNAPQLESIHLAYLVFGASEPITCAEAFCNYFVDWLVNAARLAPATTQCLRERKHQETKDGKKSFDPPPHSPQMQALNKKFAQLPGTSTLVNMLSYAAAIWYGFYLANRIY